MTIIAYKDGIMAADTASFSNAWRLRSIRPKITRLDDGSLVGCAGSSAVICAYMEWLTGKTTTKPDIKIEEDDLDALLARPDGTLWRIGSLLRPYRVEALYAVGSEVASMMALGAMYAGAIEHTIYVGGEVQVERLDTPVLAKVAVNPMHGYAEQFPLSKE